MKISTCQGVSVGLKGVDRKSVEVAIFVFFFFFLVKKYLNILQKSYISYVDASNYICQSNKIT